MGAYTTATADFDTLQNIVRTLKSGYKSADGKTHRPSAKLAAIVTLEANAGIRIGDLLRLRRATLSGRGISGGLISPSKKPGRFARFPCRMRYIDLFLTTARQTKFYRMPSYSPSRPARCRNSSKLYGNILAMTTYRRTVSESSPDKKYMRRAGMTSKRRGNFTNTPACRPHRSTCAGRPGSWKAP